MFLRALSFLLLAAVVSGETNVDLTMREPAVWESDPASMKTTAPLLIAKITGAPPGLEAKDFTLRQLDGKSIVTMKAEKVSLYKESGDRMALVVLVQGDERWMGNETYVEVDSESGEVSIVGAFEGIGPALDVLSKAGPPGSEAALLVYNENVDTKLRMTDASKLSASSLGTQQDYQNQAGVSFLPGLDSAIALLSKQTGRRRVLVVIGDGTGQTEDIATGLKERVKKLKQVGIETFTIQLSANPNDPPTGAHNMKSLGVSGYKKASSKTNIKAFAQAFAEQINQQYFVEFPGMNTASGQLFTMDGGEHEFELQISEESIEGILVKTLPWKPPAKPGLNWWIWGPIIGVVAILGFLGIRWFKNREPAPEPVEEHTIMLGQGRNDDDSFPLVGWIVPLGGPHQYQTFQLSQASTTIGSGDEAHICIDDQFMSSVHAEFVCTPDGFTVKDAGSTNGAFVNDERVESHELVDNDILSFGRTEFRFKSIN